MTDKTIGAGLSLTHPQWGAPPLHIPDGKGSAYKTELVLFRSAERTVKINWWHAPDPRKIPHNHPWNFTSRILAGGYTEIRWTWMDEGFYLREVRTYKAGDINEVPHNVFHLVDSVEPETVTEMTCGPYMDTWGYLDPETLIKTPAITDPNFLSHLQAINPHKRP